jgi:hypothetical protein
MKRMKTFELLERPVLSGNVAVAPDEVAYSLNIAGVYQDSVTRDWAMQTCRQATQLAERDRIQNTWHDVNSLGDHGILLEAVRAALVADVIVVSVYAADELPLELYVWFETWLPRRLSRAGALTALIGVAEPPDSQLVRTLEYLQAVANRAQLDFIPQQRKRPIASTASSMERIAEPGSATAQALQELYGQPYDAYSRWG